MTIQFPGNAAPFIATSRNILVSQGITLTIGTDFDAYKEIVTEERPMQKLGAPFDPELHGLNKSLITKLQLKSSTKDMQHLNDIRPPCRTPGYHINSSDIRKMF